MTPKTSLVPQEEGRLSLDSEDLAFSSWPNSYILLKKIAKTFIFSFLSWENSKAGQNLNQGQGPQRRPSERGSGYTSWNWATKLKEDSEKNESEKEPTDKQDDLPKKIGGSIFMTNHHLFFLKQQYFLENNIILLPFSRRWCFMKAITPYETTGVALSAGRLGEERRTPVSETWTRTQPWNQSPFPRGVQI